MILLPILTFLISNLKISNFDISNVEISNLLEKSSLVFILTAGNQYMGKTTVASLSHADNRHLLVFHLSQRTGASEINCPHYS